MKTLTLKDTPKSIMKCLIALRGNHFNYHKDQSVYSSLIHQMGGIKGKNDVFVHLGDTFTVDDDRNCTIIASSKVD